jgi:death-on-curing protein
VSEPRWVERLVVDAVHLDQIREHGGLAGVRDEDALEAALARARHKWHYDQTTDVTMLAAAYGFALCRNHPYRDGNKRVAFIVMVIFLDLNGLVFDASDEEIVTVMVALAEGHLSERKLAEWLRAHTGKRKGRGTGGSA